MHIAPAVIYPVGRSRFQGWLLGSALLLGAVVGLLWHQQARFLGWSQSLFWAVWLLSGFLAVIHWYRTPTGQLRWDGEIWQYKQGDAAYFGSVGVPLDLQFCLLVCLKTDTGPNLWFWPERASHAPRWQDFRRALFGSYRRADAVTGDASEF